jgi:hypothetical protein
MAAAVAAYEASDRLRTLPSRVAFAVVAVALCSLALQSQLNTRISVGAVVLGVVAVLLLDYWRAAAGVVRHNPIRVAGVILLAVGVGVVVLSSLADRPQYYAIELTRVAPLLWPVLPAAAVAAFATERRFTVFFATAFVFAFAAHSAAAVKQMRYIYYALPFMCVILGVGLSGAYALAARARSPWMLWVAALVLALSQEGSSAARLAAGRSPTSRYADDADWAPAVPTLAPLVSTVNRVVSSNSLKTLYYFGRYDYELAGSVVVETETGKELGRDERRGGTMIGAADSTRQVLEMPGRTLFILENAAIGADSGVSAEAEENVAARCKSVFVPPAAGIHAWSCVAPVDRL